MGKPRRCRNHLGEKRRPGLSKKQLRVSRVQARIKNFFYGGKINRLIFDAQVIAMNGQGEDGQQQQAGRGRTLAGSLPLIPRWWQAHALDDPREPRNQKPENYSATWKVSTCCIQSDSGRLSRMRTQRFQRKMASSLPAGLILAASSKQRMASSNSTSRVWGGRPARSCALARRSCARPV